MHQYIEQKQFGASVIDKWLILLTKLQRLEFRTMKVQSMVLAKMIKMASVPTMNWALVRRGGLESGRIFVSIPPKSPPLHVRMMKRKDNTILCQPITKSVKI